MDAGLMPAPGGPTWRDLLRNWARRDTTLVVQFIKYTLAGGVATVVDVGAFYALAWLILPSLTADDPVVRLLGIDVIPVSEIVRSRHFVLNNGLAFLLSNLSAYLMNILWVFEPGRHRKSVEVGLFYLVSGISLLVGTFTGWLLIRWLGWSTTWSYLSKIAASALVNFVCRKWIIFKH